MVRSSVSCTRCRLGAATSLLVNYEKDRTIHLCTACLATVGRMKAPLNDEARQILLLSRAEDGGGEVWQTESALYLLPPMPRQAAVLDTPHRAV